MKTKLFCVIALGIFSGLWTAAQTIPIRGRRESRAKVIMAREFEMLKTNIQAISIGLNALQSASPPLAPKAPSPQELSANDSLKQIVDAVNEISASRFHFPSNSTVGTEHSFAFPSRTEPPEDFDTFRAALPSFLSYEGSDGSVFLSPTNGSIPMRYSIVEEDLPVDELELSLYFQQAIELKRIGLIRTGVPSKFATSLTAADPSASPLTQTPLRAATERGSVIRWVPGSTLKYCILKWTFGTDIANYKLVKSNMAAASRDWEQSCNIHFEHIEELDNSPRNIVFPTNADGTRKVLFVVVQRDIGTAIAMSFFPNDAIFKRLLWINPNSYYSTSINKVGILRHEIGHILGFRHEHISVSAPVWSSSFCSGESATNSLEVVAYDRASVMHYPCESLLRGGVLRENFELKITNLDQKGAEAIYGPPGGNATGNFAFLDFDPVH